MRVYTDGVNKYKVFKVDNHDTDTIDSMLAYLGDVELCIRDNTLYVYDPIDGREQKVPMGWYVVSLIDIRCVRVMSPDEIATMLWEVDM